MRAGGIASPGRAFLVRALLAIAPALALSAAGACRVSSEPPNGVLSCTGRTPCPTGFDCVFLASSDRMVCCKDGKCGGTPGAVDPARDATVSVPDTSPVEVAVAVDVPAPLDTREVSAEGAAEVARDMASDVGLAAGLPCTDGADCKAGVCNGFARDSDEDGFGATVQFRLCGTVAPPGYVPVSTLPDCCDMDPGTHPCVPGMKCPGPRETADRCGNFDLDCNGAVVKVPSTYVRRVMCMKPLLGSCMAQSREEVETPPCGQAYVEQHCEDALLSLGCQEVDDAEKKVACH